MIVQIKNYKGMKEYRHLKNHEYCIPALWEVIENYKQLNGDVDPIFFSYIEESVLYSIYLINTSNKEHLLSVQYWLIYVQVRNNIYSFPESNNDHPTPKKIRGTLENTNPITKAGSGETKVSILILEAFLPRNLIKLI